MSRSRPLAWTARTCAVAVLSTLAVGAPVVGASADPQPVTPTAETLAVPEVPGTAASAPASPSASPAAPATGTDPELATGPVGTRGFRMVSVHWQGQESADLDVQVRVRSDDGWSRWQSLPVDDSAPDPGTAEARHAAATVATEPLWVSGGADGVDVRVSGQDTGDVDHVAVSLIDPQQAPADSAVQPVATASAAAAAKPSIITRAQWGADEGLRLRNCAAPTYTGTPKVAFVHHTAGSNDYTKADSAAIVRGIYYQHTVVQGWCDIGYNFLVDKYGQIFEGRYGGMDKAVMGAHAAGFNANSFGVSVLGNYSLVTPGSAIMNSLAKVIAWKLGMSQTNPLGRTTLTSAGKGGTNIRYDAGAVVPLNVISGHRDVGATECPGNYLYAQLPALRQKVAALMRETWWELRDSATPGSAQHQVYYGAVGAQQLSCDWDGDGVDGIAVYSAGTWRLRGSASTGGTDLTVQYGSASMVPVCGDWDGDGKDSLGVYEPATATWWLRNSTTAGPPDLRFSYGFAGVVPVVGDWNGDGRDGIGVYDGSRWWLRETATPGVQQARFSYGWSAARPVVGDWDGNGTQSVGVYYRGQWWLRNSATAGTPDRLFTYGLASDAPVTGRWSAQAGDGVGVTRSWP